MKKPYAFLALLVLSSLLLVQCSGDDNAPVSAPKRVYAVGYTLRAGSGDRVATLWIDGVPSFLPDGGEESFANDVFVKGSDVYVSGYYTNSNNYEVACYWKNGVKTDLAPSNKFSVAYGITVTGNGDVYIAGDSEENKPCYWKNGVITVLSQTVDAYATNIFVQNNDVFVSGLTKGTGSNRIACYWKNGVKTDLTNATQDAFANSVFVVGNDVYVSGKESVCTVWKNGQAIPLGGNFAKEVKILNGQVLVVGQKASKATLWRDQVETTVSSSANTSQGRDFDLDGEDVYVAGNETIEAVVTARIWKNQQPITITVTGESNINAIAVR